MSTHKIMDKICAVAIAVAVIASLALWGFSSESTAPAGIIETAAEIRTRHNINIFLPCLLLCCVQSLKK